MVLNRQGKRMSLGKNWEMTKNNGGENLTRPLSSLINIFNSQRSISSPLKIHPTIKEIAVNDQPQNSPSQKSVKSFIQESKVLKKKALLSERPKTQVFPAFGPKSFSTDTSQKSDLSEAFSRLILSRQAKPVVAKPAVTKEIVPNRLVNLKPVESKAKPKVLDEQPLAVVPSKLSIEEKKALFDKKVSSVAANTNQKQSNNIKTNLSSIKIPKQVLKPAEFKSETIYLQDYEDIDDSEGYQEYSASFLSCSSILPRSSATEDMSNRKNTLPLSDINDLIGNTDNYSEETDLDRTLNNDSIFDDDVFGDSDSNTNDGYLLVKIMR